MDAQDAFERYLDRHPNNPCNAADDDDVTYDIRCDPKAHASFYPSNTSYGPNGYFHSEYSLEDGITDRERAIEKARIACAILGEEMFVYAVRRWGDENTGDSEENIIADLVWCQDEQKVVDA